MNVCPTGIDIRDGIQLECISCGLCMDACNEVMHKTGAQPWLINWDTLAGQAAKAAGKSYKLHLVRPRTMIYAVALSLAVCGLVVGLLLRAPTTLALIHDRAPLFIRLRDGGIRNGYTLKIANKTELAGNYQLSVVGLPGARLMLPEASASSSDALEIIVPRSEVAAMRLILQGYPPVSENGEMAVEFSLRNDATGQILKYTSTFMAPATDGAGDTP